MAKPWHEKELWEKVYLGRHSKTYLAAGRIVGHLGCGAFQFWDAAKLEPGYDKHRFENALRDLTDWQKRERGQYELTPRARKVLRIILGPSPDDPEYRRWWELRRVSVKQMTEQGQPVEWAKEPPVPLDPPSKDATSAAKEPTKRKTVRKK